MHPVGEKERNLPCRQLMRTAALAPMCWNICRMNCVLSWNRTVSFTISACMGPDLLFYYHAAKSNPVGALGNAMHEEPGRVFFDRARRVVHCEADRDAALAYALGFVCTLRWTAPATRMWSSSPGKAA